jgi:hypothetical protein
MSINQQDIQKNESGLSVRAKINSMFKALISGDEGINAVWKKIQNSIGYVPKVGDVETLPPGSDAVVQVTNDSAKKESVYDFGIPQGIKGDTVSLGGETTYTLYNTPGENTDGAMTQAATNRLVTDSISTEQDRAIQAENAINNSITELEEIVSNIDRIFDGGMANTVYGGSRPIDCGGANSVIS